MTAATELRMTAHELTSMGATQAQTVQVRPGVTRVVNAVARDQTVSLAANDPKIELTPDQNDLRSANAAANQALFSPRMALNRMLNAAVGDKNMSGADRAKAASWLRREKAMRGRGGRAFTKIQLKTGRDLVAQMSPRVAMKADPSMELRHSIGAQKATNRNEAKLNQIFRKGAQSLTQTGAQIKAQATTSVSAAKLQSPAFSPARRGGVPVRGAYAALKKMAPEAALLMEVAKKTVQVAKLVHEVPKPEVPQMRPTMRRRRLMVPGMAA